MEVAPSLLVQVVDPFVAKVATFLALRAEDPQMDLLTLRWDHLQRGRSLFLSLDSLLLVEVKPLDPLVPGADCECET